MVSIDGVIMKRLRKIPDERGFLMEILRQDDREFLSEFGQVYLTIAYPNVVKAWHYHKKQDDNFCVIKGMAKVVLFDRRENSKTKDNLLELYCGDQDLCVIHIPVGVMHGFKAIGNEPAYLLNTITKMYNHFDPDEFRVPYTDKSIPYDWNKDINR